VQTWQEARWLLMKGVVEKRPVRIETHNERREIQFHSLETASLTANDLDGDFLEKLGLSHFRPVLAPVIGRLVPGGVGERAGLKEGDEVVAVDGKAIANWDELVAKISASAGQSLSLRVKQGTSLRELAVTPASVREKGKQVGRIGVAPKVDEQALEKKLLTEVRYPPFKALGQALYKTWDTARFTLEMLGRMVVGEVSLKNISGPITIADYAGQSAHMGWQPYLIFLALISISLGVLNLLPVPLLDGGHLMYYMAEIVKGSPVSERTLEIGQKVGMALLLTLMAFAFYNDLNRLF
jgi:regulator of sigma E protease